MSAENLYIIIPAYNEADNIEKCVKDWYPVIERHNDDNRSRLVIINDGSKDNTLEILKDLENSYPLLTTLDKPNGGHGSAVLYGYNFAIYHHADYIFQTDSDGQTNPNEFEQFWALKENYDAILGERLVRGDGKTRKFVENTVCLILKIIFGVKAKDANAPFRLMKTDLVAKYIDKLPENYNIPNIMFTTFFLYFGEKIRFIPITFKPREAGINTINMKKIIKIGWSAVKDFIKLKKSLIENS